MNGYIKLDQKILEWEWYKDINTCKLFLHLLLKSCHVDRSDYESHIPVSEISSSYRELSTETGLSERSVRTALDRLKKSGEIEVINRKKKSNIIIIKNYCMYYSSSENIPVETQEKQPLSDKENDKENDKEKFNFLKKENKEISTKNEVLENSESDKNDKENDKENGKEKNVIFESKNQTEKIYCKLFQEFYNAYPRIGNISESKREFVQIVLNNQWTDAKNLVLAAKNYAEYCTILEKQDEFIPYPENWLKKSYWIGYLPENYKKPKQPRKFKTGFSNFQERDYDFEELEQQILKSQEKEVKKVNKITVYTDGSSLGNGSPDSGCGWACKLIYRGHEKVKSGGDVGKTNNYMEMTAVLMAMRNITNKSIPVEVFSDSKYVVETLNGNYAVKKNVELWKEIIEEMSSFSDIKFFWVKGHDKNQHNNDVDKAAVEESKKAITSSRK